MRVTHLSLSNFRNYVSAEVPFVRGLNLIVGKNGQGKTNLAEAISYFSSLSSHRVSVDSALIRSGAESAIVRMRVGVDEREVLLEVQLNAHQRNRAQVNKHAVKPRELTRWFSSVLFAPEDLLLVRGEPAVRRRFLDESLIARQPSFAATIAEYDRVVRQRSALLKAARVSGKSKVVSSFDFWDEQLVDLGSSIMLARRKFVTALQGPLQLAYQQIVNQDHSPAISPIESVSTKDLSADVSRETFESAFRSALQDVRAREIERGMTLLGPHRDDALFELNHLPVKGFASHGETWSYVLGLRLAVAQLLRDESSAGDPVILLDDVFAELDVQRRNALMNAVSSFEQVIVTAAVEADVPQGEWHHIWVNHGEASASEAKTPQTTHPVDALPAVTAEALENDNTISDLVLSDTVPTKTVLLERVASAGVPSDSAPENAATGAVHPRVSRETSDRHTTHDQEIDGER